METVISAGEKLYARASETSLEGWKQVRRMAFHPDTEASETSLEGWKPAVREG